MVRGAGKLRKIELDGEVWEGMPRGSPLHARFLKPLSGCGFKAERLENRSNHQTEREPNPGRVAASGRRPEVAVLPEEIRSAWTQ
jgi:hypothetical protein